MRHFTHSIGGVTALILCFLFLNGCSRDESSAAPEAARNTNNAVKVSVVTVKPTPIRDVLVLPGDTEAWQDVRVSADTAGRVEWVGPAEGDAVKKGQLIAKIDVSALAAALARAEAALKLADDLYKRRKRLFERAIINQEELNRSLTERTLAQGALGWVWARSGRTIPIPGFRSVRQVEENARAMAFGPLSSQPMREIDRLLGRD